MESASRAATFVSVWRLPAAVKPGAAVTVASLITSPAGSQSDQSRVRNDGQKNRWFDLDANGYASPTLDPYGSASISLPNTVLPTERSELLRAVSAVLHWHV